MTTPTSRPCPICSQPSIRVIYMGFPLLLCSDEECSCLFGWWMWLMDHVPYNGWFMTYEGSYWPALWAWLTNWGEDE